MAITPSAVIGVTGLAVMGSSLARNLARHGHSWPSTTAASSSTAALVAEHGDEGASCRRSRRPTSSRPSSGRGGSSSWSRPAHRPTP